MMNTIDPAELKVMFSKEHENQLAKLISGCSNGVGRPDVARYAPSIITRSELELFGLSSPRFAARFYIDENRRFFVNARRLNTIRDANPRYAPRRNLPPNLQNKKLVFDAERFANEKPLKEQLANQPCVADGFLPPPDADTHFHHHLCDLAVPYGEALSTETNYAGSPFMRHIHLAGGGLCAQAVCFIATVLHYRNAARVHGLAEITYLASFDPKDSDPPRELLISGLDFIEMATYFKRAGLHSILQRVRPANADNAPPVMFEHAVRAYLLSNMPVIFAVDCALLDGRFSLDDGYVPGELLGAPRGFNPYSPDESFYLKNAESLRGGCHPFPFNYHAVIATGATLDPCGPTEFSIHDPLKKPFMKAKAAHLFDSAAWLTREGATKDKPNYVSMAGCFLPVTPPKVKMPLGLWFTEDELAKMDLPHNQCLPGREGLLSHIRYATGDSDCRHLRLIKCSALKETLDDLCGPTHAFLYGYPEALEKLPGDALQIEEFLKSKLPDGSEHWLWLHCHQSTIWIWNAEDAPRTDRRVIVIDESAVNQFLIAKLQFSGDRWGLVSVALGGMSAPEPESPPPQDLRKPAGRPLLDRSIITSVAVTGIKDALRAWPSPSADVPSPALADLYAFMQKDADNLLKPFCRAADMVAVAAKTARIAADTVAAAAKTVGAVAETVEEEAEAVAKEADTVAEDAEMIATIAKTIASSPQTAVEMMAELADNTGAIDSIAAELHKIFHAHSLAIGAFATFTPELTRDNGSLADCGRNAVRFLVRLARRLQAERHPVRAIELVAGSLIDGVWPAKFKGDSPDNECHGASLLDWRESMATLLHQLRPVVLLIKDTKHADATLPGELTLALELEPGPLYLIGDPERAEYLCDLLDREENKDISPYIGLNIDIPHWGFIAGAKPADLLKTSVFRRITHAHISDHANGHFCDNVPLLIHKKPDFWPWLDVLEERAARNDEFAAQGYPRFTACVSLELEATKLADQVQAGHHYLFSLIHRLDEQST